MLPREVEMVFDLTDLPSMADLLNLPSLAELYGRFKFKLLNRPTTEYHAMRMYIL